MSCAVFYGALAVLILLLLVMMQGCARVKPAPEPTPAPAKYPAPYPKPYVVLGKTYQPLPHARGFTQSGEASWYGEDFHGKKTSSGEIYNMYAISAAHKTLPLGTYVRVSNLNNGKEIIVRVNDRGPFVRDRIIDLSYAAAKKLGIVGPGIAPVKIVALGEAALPETKSGTGQSYIPTDYYTGNFTIQIGAFSDRNNAERLKQKLDQLYKNVQIESYNGGNEVLYRVRVGRCSTLEEATKYETFLIQNGFSDAFTIAE